MFYAKYAKERLEKNLDVPRSLGRDNNPSFQRERAVAIRDLLIKLGLKPDHTVLDYGCGSLWVGEALIEYLEPGGYAGVDVIDDFYRDAILHIPEALIDEKQPKLGLIGDELRPEGARRPFDFVISTEVMLHVPPDELGEYFRNITSMAAETTRILIMGALPQETKYNGSVWFHGHDAVASSLAELGYEITPVRYLLDQGRVSLRLFEIQPPVKPQR